MNRDLGEERREYGREKMEISGLPADPMELFSHWLKEALQSGIPDPTAMTLSTVDKDGRPSSRIVLLKKFEEGSLVFYTNFRSKKGRDLEANNRVAVHFYWPELERQIRISGEAKEVSQEDADHYFSSRPYESKIAAWASPQSETIPDRDYLEKEFKKYQVNFSARENIPRPRYWGGYSILPSRIEFWQGGLRRLHDRIVYRKSGEHWDMERLAP